MNHPLPPGAALRDHRDVEYTLTVTDRETVAVRTYFNPLGNKADANTDTSAFDTCP